jgi:hypothetical protein
MTSKETLELTFLTNEHGLKFPVPLEFWPKDVHHASIDTVGKIIFWDKTPVLVGRIYWALDACRYSHGFTETPEDSSKTLWTRPVL